MRSRFDYFQPFTLIVKRNLTQVCIPVGCVPPAALTGRGRWGCVGGCVFCREDLCLERRFSVWRSLCRGGGGVGWGICLRESLSRGLCPGGLCLEGLYLSIWGGSLPGGDICLRVSVTETYIPLGTELHTLVKHYLPLSQSER